MIKNNNEIYMLHTRLVKHSDKTNICAERRYRWKWKWKERERERIHIFSNKGYNKRKS